MVVFGMRRRSWSAVAAVLGLVASLLAVGSPPVSGVAGEADNEPVYSACVGPALESQGLVDVVGSFAEDAVNCLAHFEVTQGRTETTYDPGAPVLRWQMALFLSRAAGPAGIALPANPEVGFTDTGEVFEEGRTAIAQMAQLRVMRGRSSTSFRPNEPVSRAEMAEMLDSFLAEAEKASGLGLGALGGNGAALSDVAPDDEVFSDIGGVTRGQHAAVRRMFEAGVARGTADGLFNPGGLVTRAQMAVFITRMLAHTAARPAGLTIQAAEQAATVGDSVELAISVRDNDLAPMPDALVDMFSAADPDEAFGEDGRCSDEGVSQVGGVGLCQAALGDASTDPSGDIEATASDLRESTTVWAWTGAAGDVFDNDDVSSSSASITITKPGIKLMVTDDMPEGATSLEFGGRVVFTLQVVDEDGKAVAVEDVSVRVAAAETQVNAGSDPAAESTQRSTSVYKTDASGEIELSYRQTDPRPASNNTGDSARLDLDITPLGDSALELADKTTLEKAGAESGTDAEDAAAVWRDSSPVPTALTLSQAVEYREASAVGNGVPHMITAKLTDQYGQGIGRAQIFFRSDDQEGVGAEGDGLTVSKDGHDEYVFWQDGTRYAVDCDFPVLTFDNLPLENGLTAFRCLEGEPRNSNRRTTRSNGEAVFSYSRDSDEMGIETIWASYELPRVAGAAAETLVSNRIYHYWAKSADSGSVSGRLLVRDADANRAVIYGPEGPMVFAYDSNDHLNSLDGPDRYDNFHEQMGRSEDAGPPTHLRVDAYEDRAKTVNQLTLSGEQGHQPSTEIVELLGESSRMAASNTGVIAVSAGDGQVFVFDGADDATPQVLDETENGAFTLGHDLAISDDGAVIVASDPYYFSGSYGDGVYGGIVLIYTRGSNGLYTQTAMLTDRESAPWMFKQETGSDTHEFGSGVDISGDGRTIAVASPGDQRSVESTNNCELYVERDREIALVLPETGELYRRTITVRERVEFVVPGLCIEGYVRVFERPNSGWADDGGGDTDTSFGLIASYKALVGSNLGVSVSDDGSVVAVGSPGITSTDDVIDAGGVYVWVRPGNGWPTSSAKGATAKLTLAGADAVSATEELRRLGQDNIWRADLLGRRVGAGARVSGDGSTVVLPGFNDFIDGPDRESFRQELYVFNRPAGGWDGDTSDYEVLTPDAEAPRPSVEKTITETRVSTGPNPGDYDSGTLHSRRLELPDTSQDDNFGAWVDVNDDGNEVISGRFLWDGGDYRGSVVLFARGPSGGWSMNSDFIGAAPGDGYGRYAVFAGDDAIAAMYRFGGRLSIIGR